MSWLEDNYDEIMMDQYSWREAVEEYIADLTDLELMKETSETLRSLPDYAKEDKNVEKARSILNKGIIYQRLTERQRYALGDFVYSGN